MDESVNRFKGITAVINGGAHPITLQPGVYAGVRIDRTVVLEPGDELRVVDGSPCLVRNNSR